jgi:hypothetical protein
MLHHDRAISVDDVAAFLTSAKKRRARDAGLDDSIRREITLPTVKGYLQVFEDMPGELKVQGSEAGGRRAILDELDDICHYSGIISFHSGSECRRRRRSAG